MICLLSPFDQQPGRCRSRCIMVAFGRVRSPSLSAARSSVQWRQPDARTEIMDEHDAVEILRYANQLKRTARTGWVQRGVAEAEDVAAHSYGVVFATLLLARLVEDAIDLGRALALAVLHDLPEALTTDIPSPAWRLLPAGLKAGVERSAIETMLGSAPFAGEWLAWHDELTLN